MSSIANFEDLVRMDFVEECEDEEVSGNGFAETMTSVARW